MGSTDWHKELAYIPRVGEGKRLLIVTPNIPHPSQGASTVLFFWYIAALKAADYRVLNVLLAGPDFLAEDIENYRRAMAIPGQFDIAVISRPQYIIPGMFSLHLDREAPRQLAALAREFEPDLLFCLDLTSAWCARVCACKKKIAWLGDLSFQTGWYHAIYAYREGQKSVRTLLKLLVSLIRSQLWKKPYRHALANFSRIVVASKSSEAALAELGLTASYAPYPWPAEPPYRRIPPLQPTLVFCGSFDALGSRASFHALVYELYPRLCDLFGDGAFRVKVCGRGKLPDWVVQAFRERKEFEVLGFVPKIEAVFAESHVMIAPVEVPVGNRSRILTALSQRLPVIAHRNTSLGNPDLRDGENCLLADSADEFIERIRTAFEKPDLSQRIAAMGYELYVQKFSPANASRRLLEEMTRLH